MIYVSALEAYWNKYSIFKNDLRKIKDVKQHTVLSLINAPGALQFFKRGIFIRGKFSMQKMQWF